MSLKNIFSIGEKIEIFLRENNLDDSRGFSMIQDIKGDKDLIVTLPTFEARPLLLEPGNGVEIFFFRENGIFSFYGEVIDRFRVHDLVVLKITQVSPINRVQRREFYRLKTSVPITFSSMDKEDKDPPVYKGYSVNISGSGMGFITNNYLKPGILIHCNIQIQDKIDLYLKGRVVRVALSEVSEYKYEIGILFYDISERVQEELVRFIFDKQRELMKKGFI